MISIPLLDFTATCPSRTPHPQVINAVRSRFQPKYQHSSLHANVGSGSFLGRIRFSGGGGRGQVDVIPRPSVKQQRRQDNPVCEFGSDIGELGISFELLDRRLDVCSLVSVCACVHEHLSTLIVHTKERKRTDL